MFVDLFVGGCLLMVLGDCWPPFGTLVAPLALLDPPPGCLWIPFFPSCVRFLVVWLS